MLISPSIVKTLAQDRFMIKNSTNTTCWNRRFCGFFGFSPRVTARIWNTLLLQHKLPEGGKLFHLLWTFAFLKLYDTETVYSTWFGVTEKTFRKWVWKFINVIHTIELIKFSNRFMSDNGSICKITLDGTDCPIQEPRPFSPRWYSHKFKAAGLRYEVGLCIQTGWIVWVNGPYACGRYPDLTIARDKIVNFLHRGEKILADGGYRDGRVYMETPTGLNNYDQRMKKLARARHETVNSRLKIFSILRKLYRHDLNSHRMVFHSIAVMTQIAIQVDHPLFQIYYYDR